MRGSVVEVAAAVAVHHKAGEPPRRVVHPGLPEMNEYKIRSIIGWIRAQGKLPRDAYGQMLSVDDLMSWFRLDECLTPGEQLYMRKELAVMVEAELSLDELKSSELLP